MEVMQQICLTTKYNLLANIRFFLLNCHVTWSEMKPACIRQTSSLMLWLKVSLLVCLRTKQPCGAYNQIFITVRQLWVCWCEALSMTRGGVCSLQLLLAFASAVSQSVSHSRVQVPWDLWPYFTVSDSRLLQPGWPDPRIYKPPQEQGGPIIPPKLWVPFSSPPSIHKVTVKVLSPCYLRNSKFTLSLIKDYGWEWWLARKRKCE
jgi:hypothetical protein